MNAWLKWSLWGSGVALAGGIGWWFYSRSRALDALGVPMEAAGITLEGFTAALPPEGKPYAGVIWQVYQETGIDPLILAAIASQETHFGTASDCNPKGPGCTGDFTPRAWTKNPDGTVMALPPDGLGWGRGIWQMDYWWWRSWLDGNDWRNPYVNCSKAASILLDDAKWLSIRGVSGDLLLRGALAAYNANRAKVLSLIHAAQDPDLATGKNTYAARVLGYATTYAVAAGVGSPAALPV